MNNNTLEETIGWIIKLKHASMPDDVTQEEVECIAHRFKDTLDFIKWAGGEEEEESK